MEDDDLDIAPRTGCVRRKEANAFDVHEEDHIFTRVDGFQERKISKLGRPVEISDWGSANRTFCVVVLMVAAVIVWNYYHNHP